MQSSTPTSLQHSSKETTTDFSHLSSRDLKVRNNHRRTLSSIHTQGGGESRNSSLGKLWAEDYYDSDDNTNTSHNEEGNTDTNTFVQRHNTPSIHPSANTVPFTGDLQEQSLPRRPLRTHQRSLTALLPFHNSSNSPERKFSSTSIDVDSFMPTLTGDSDGVINVADKSKGGIASWFTGTSATVPVGVPALDKEPTPHLSPSASIMSLRDSTPDRGKLKKRPALAAPEPTIIPLTPTRNNPGTATSRFGSFFSSPKTPSRSIHTVQIPASQAESDPLLGDLLSVLYPTSGDSETFSPAAYKNLQMQAEGTILRLQTAYKIQLAAVHEIAAEREAVREEKEETDLKAQCLQGKIDALLFQDAEKTAQIEEQDLVISKLMTDLVLEKQARAAEKETREKSIALLKSQAEVQQRRGVVRSESSTDEDLGISSARRNRDSRDSEMTVESDMDSCADSVFSISRSPTEITLHPISTSASSVRSSLSPSDIISEVQLQHASPARIVPNPSLHPTANTPVFLPRPKAVAQKSTFQKLLSGMGTQETGTVDKWDGIGMGNEGCGNCRGKEASAAWDAVGLMRAENRGLKERIGELEGSVEEALDLIR